jgi:hypothetical protein
LGREIALYRLIEEYKLRVLTRWECKLYSHVENSSEIPQKPANISTYESAISFLGIHPKEIKSK